MPQIRKFDIQLIINEIFSAAESIRSAAESTHCMFHYLSLIVTIRSVPSRKHSFSPDFFLILIFFLSDIVLKF